MGLFSDLRTAWRFLARSPGSTCTVVLILALGVGANTAILTLVNAILWKQMPFSQPERLVSLWSKRSDRDKAPLSIPDYQDFRAEATQLADVAAFASWGANLTGEGETERLQGVKSTANIFQLLGVNAIRGRTLAREDDSPDSQRVVVLSHGLWQRRFGASAEIIGKTLSLNGDSYTVAGILPPGFFFPIREADFVVPLVPEADPRRRDRGDHFLSSIARLKPSAMLTQAERQLTATARRLQSEYPTTNAKNSGVRLIDLSEEVVGNFRSSLLTLVGAAGVLLLLAWSSLANLSLSRASGRGHEFAIRTSLGASRLVLARQILMETLAMSVAGGIAATGVAYAVLRGLESLSPPGLPRLAEVEIDGRFLILSLTLAILSGVCAGIVPAITAPRTGSEGLRSGSRGATGGRGSLRIRSVLSGLQLALSLVLLIVAGLLLRSFVRLQAVRPGFDASGVLALRIALMPTSFPSPESIAVFHDGLRKQLEQLPGVQSAGAISILPTSGLLARADFTIEGHPPASPEDTPSANYRVAGPGYFSAMKIQLIGGRDFTDADARNTVPVAIVNRALAKRFWPDSDAVGAHIHIDGFGSGEAQIVGVVADVKQAALTDGATMDLYLPYAQAPKGALALLRNNMYWVIRSRQGPLSLEGAARRTVFGMNKDVAVSSSMALEQYLAASIAPRKFNLILLAAFAISALTLAVVAVYSVTSHSVTLRTREMGLRMALGAQRLDVLRLVLRQGMVLTMSGIGAGLMGALAATRFLSGSLYQTQPVDGLTFTAVSCLLAGAGFLASYVPALRATKVDPQVALRQE
jgi:predicted permease